MRPACLLALLLFSTSCLAQETIKADVYEFPTIAQKTGPGEYEGFLIDLWSNICADLQWSCELRDGPTPDPDDGDRYDRAIAKLQSKESDVILAPMTITEARAAQVDFPFPYLRTGLRILVRNEGQQSFWSSFDRPDIFRAILFFIIFIVIIGIVYWVIERNRENSTVKTVHDGIKLAFNECSTIGTGNIYGSHLAVRYISLLTFFIGTLFVASVTATITAERTINQLTSEVQHPNDLAGKSVATVTGTYSEKACRKYGAIVDVKPQLNDAVFALVVGEVDAVVYDAPAIEAYAKGSAASRVRMTGPLFEPQYYGIAVYGNKELEDSIGQAVLRMIESGQYDEIHNKWFLGDSDG